MDYRYIKAFILTAQYSSFSKAADQMKIAQSAVSRQVKLLEEAVGEELIIRSSKKFILTQKGKEFFIAAKSFDQVAYDIFEKKETREIKIGILQGLLKNWFNPILIKFYKKNNRNLSISIGDQRELKTGLGDGLFDIIFTTENIQSDLISSLRLFEEKLVLISREEINKKKLHEQRWILYPSDDNLFKLSKKHSSSILRVESINTIINMVKNNIGVAIIPDHVLKKAENLHIQKLNNFDHSEIYMATLNYKTMPSHIKEIANIVKKTI